MQNWKSELNSSPKALFYRSIKDSFDLEPYLDILPKDLRIPLTKMRLSNHRLSIEKGRWSNIPRMARLCPFCNQFGDEFHALYECKEHLQIRTQYLKPFFFKRPNMYKSYNLFNTKNKQNLSKLSKFIKAILKCYT